jgi:hypothetical protein
LEISFIPTTPHPQKLKKQTLHTTCDTGHKVPRLGKKKQQKPNVRELPNGVTMRELQPENSPFQGLVPEKL